MSLIEHLIDISDPLSYKCTCPASTSEDGGLILLFYRYFTQPPSLPTTHHHLASTPEILSDFHRHLSAKFQLGGKIRVANEGFNITVGGTTDAIQPYISELVSHWSFDGLDLTSEDKREKFFKPSRGCACAFGGVTRVSVKEEITPLGVSGYVPDEWSIVRSLEPEEWHDMFLKQDGSGDLKERILVDVRNHYESRIGYFIDPATNTPAIRPGIRRFSQWPGFASRFFSTSTLPPSQSSFANGAVAITNTGLPEESKQIERVNSSPRPTPPKEIFTYCTGGIRCEKGVRWLASHLTSSMEPSSEAQSTRTHSGMIHLNGSEVESQQPTLPQAQPVIYTLHGGISAYLMWMDNEIVTGKKITSESLFKGRNYVFDGRGSIGLASSSSCSYTPSSTSSTDLNTRNETSATTNVEKVATCHKCSKPEDRLGKCKVQGCHLVLVICQMCDLNDDYEGGKGVKCCEGCTGKGICECERARELELWGGDRQVRIGKVRGRRGTVNLKAASKAKAEDEKGREGRKKRGMDFIDVGPLNIDIKFID